MKIWSDKNKCDLCGLCVAICPENALTLTETDLLIDASICTCCLDCVTVCPLGAIEVLS